MHIFDVYYDDDDDGRPIATHEIPSTVYGDTLEELQDKLDLLALALAKPILDESEIGSRDRSPET
ncbi:hypothetical protein ACQQ2N_03140 [Dokdonella sp. MW10]|uniref:hypothetical protein n=1 Tax=Dokdonella sp. MW10 TaxID=2992926 RepID=UPI003F807042